MVTLEVPLPVTVPAIAPTDSVPLVMSCNENRDSGASRGRSIQHGNRIGKVKAKVLRGVDQSRLRMMVGATSVLILNVSVSTNVVFTAPRETMTKSNGGRFRTIEISDIARIANCQGGVDSGGIPTMRSEVAVGFVTTAPSCDVAVRLR